MTLTDIRVVGVDVTDQDAALTFFSETLGFSVQMDGETPAGRWLVVASRRQHLCRPHGGPCRCGHDTGIRFGTTDAVAAHQHLVAHGVTVGTIDGHLYTTSFMAIGDGSHKLPVTAETLTAIGKAPGDTVTVHLTERRAR